MGILDTRYVYRSPTKHIGTNPPGTQIPNKMCRYYTAVGTYQKVSRDKPDPGAPRPQCNRTHASRTTLSRILLKRKYQLKWPMQISEKHKGILLKHSQYIKKCQILPDVVNKFLLQHTKLVQWVFYVNFRRMLYQETLQIWRMVNTVCLPSEKYRSIYPNDLRLMELIFPQENSKVKIDNNRTRGQ